METKTKIAAPEGKQDIFITREFDLPVELLFKAYTQTEFIEKWMETKVIKLENKNHGSYEFETSFNGNVVFTANGTIHQVIQNRSITRTFEMGNSSIGVQLEYLEFEEITKDRCKLMIHIIYRSEQHRAEQLKLPFAMGLNMAHDKLQEILTTTNTAI